MLLLTSHSESFPNVVAESMLCTTPVLSTNAGCSKKIIANTGFVLKKNDPISINNALNKALNVFLKNKKKWRSLKIKSRIQIIKNFSINLTTYNYLKNWIN